jgi:hypothetical protein
VQLGEVASATRIPLRYLEALESNAPLDAYPAPVYARAFLREYALYLKIDPDPLLARFGTSGPEEIHLLALSEAVPRPRRWPARVLLVLSIGGLVALAVLGVLAGGKQSPRAFGPLPHPSEKHVASHAPPSPSHPHVRKFTGITAALHVQDRSWVGAVVDGRQRPGRIFESSQAHTYSAKHTLDLTLGNAGGVRLVLNGKRIPTGGPGDVVRLAIAFESGKIHVTRA